MEDAATQYRASLMGYASGTKPMQPLTIEYIVCVKMGWDRAQYRHQPPSFINSILRHMGVEADVMRAKEQEAIAKANAMITSPSASPRRGR